MKSPRRIRAGWGLCLNGNLSYNFCALLVFPILLIVAALNPECDNAVIQRCTREVVCLPFTVLLTTLRYSKTIPYDIVVCEILFHGLILIVSALWLVQPLL